MIRMILIAAIAITLTANIARAGETAPATLTLTESSPSILSATYNGPSGNSAFSVQNTSPDHWTLTINNPEISFQDFNFFWEEPEDPVNSANQVFHSTEINSNQIFVISDLVADAFPNNTTSPVVGFEDSQFGFADINIKFNDLGDQAPTGVPDTGSTLCMLTLASISLLGLNRFRSLRLA
jgi:hypothetical protein